MNWNAWGKATGWLPGALGGSIVGLIISVLYWSSEKANTCPGIIEGYPRDCVHVVFGTFDDFGGFAAACGAIGGVVGFFVNIIAAELDKH